MKQNGPGQTEDAENIDIKKKKTKNKQGDTTKKAYWGKLYIVRDLELRPRDVR